MTDHERTAGLTRRGFITTVGAGAAGVAALGQVSAGERAPEVTAASEVLKVTLSINGRQHRVLVEPRWTLLFVLREKLGLTATKVGCERGECGACTVLIDGKTQYACMTLAAEAAGHEVTTLEGLMDGEELGPVQRAFAEHDAYQCGYCTPGQIVAAEGLLRANPTPSRDEVRFGMSGNICRCGAYAHIVKAVEKAATLRKGGV